MATATSAFSDDTIEVQTFFHGIGMDTRLLPDPRAKSRDVARRRAGFLIGSAPGVDAPCDTACVLSDSHPLVRAVGGAYVVSATPEMDGEVCVDGQTHPLRALLAAQGADFTLPPGAHARLDCGATTFVVRATARPQALPVPVVSWDRRELRYLLASVAALTLFVLMVFAIPPDPKSLSLDMFGRDGGMVKTLIKPPVVPEEPAPWLSKPAPAGPGGKAAADTAGQAGNKTSRNQHGRMAIKGPPDNPDPRVAKELAVAKIQNTGVLGVLSRNQGALVASILSDDRALGKDADNVMGQLVAARIDDAYGRGGLSSVGTGAGGGGTGKGTIGDHKLGTIGPGNGRGNEYGHCIGTDCGTGIIGRRVAKTPDIITGVVTTHGNLDKEIIRRIVRRHLNEVKYCYTQELAKYPELGGRIVVQFAINGTGQVMSSVLQSSTMGNARVENCTVQAVRRWEFPAPERGGMAFVSYPFVLVPAGGTS